MTLPRSEAECRAERASDAFQAADEADAKARVSSGDDIVFKLDAKDLRARGNDFLQAPSDLAAACGEAVTRPAPDDFSNPTQEVLANTLLSPKSVSVAASEHRLRAVKTAGILAPALDAAQSGRAANSVEKMLCHQMTAAHFDAMRFLALARNELLPPADAAKYMNAAARLMDVYQTACLVLQKLKTKGQQQIVVHHQQVNVSEGGQAVVAGTVDGASRRKRGRRAKTEG